MGYGGGLLLVLLVNKEVISSINSCLQLFIYKFVVIDGQTIRSNCRNNMLRCCLDFCNYVGRHSYQALG
jgi:hypothetical protein